MALLWSGVFSGSNYLSIANYTGNPSAFSVSCWVNLATTQLSRIFFANFLTGGSNKGWAVGISDGTNNKIKFYLGSNTLFQTGTLTPGTWTHAVFTWDGTTAAIYLNGNTTPDNTLVSGVVYGTVPANNYIGTLDGTNQEFNGSLAGVGYWSKALSTAEVAALYNGGKGLNGAELSGTLLTSLGSYQDFYNASSLGADASGGGHNYANNGSVSQFVGPGGSVWQAPNVSSPPARKAAVAAWKGGLLFALSPGHEAGNVVGVRDYVTGTLFPFQTSAMTRAVGPYGPELDNTHTGSNGVKFGLVLQGSTQFTLSCLCLCDAYNNLSHLWSGENSSTADMRIALSGTSGNLFFQLGADGAFPNLNVTVPLNQYILVTCRLAPGGVRSIWFGQYKIAERTDAGVAYGSGAETNGSGWGGSPQSANRAWSGRLTAGYAWNRALSDAEIVALAADPFAPVRPAPPRLSFLKAAVYQSNAPIMLAQLAGG